MPDDGAARTDGESDNESDEPTSDPVQAVGITALGDPSGAGTMAAVVFVVLYEAATATIRGGRDLIRELVARRRARG